MNNDDYNRNKKIVNDRRRINKDLKDQKLQDRFKRKIKTHGETILIGTLEIFENEFGYLWGHSKSPNMLTPEEREMKELWTITREQILNNGHDRIRYINNEYIDKFRIQNQKITFRLNTKDQDNE